MNKRESEEEITGKKHTEREKERKKEEAAFTVLKFGI